MRPNRRTISERILIGLAGVLILKTVASVVLNYSNYFPPNFASDFLRGRERYFWGIYQAAFHSHIVSGPVSLILGLLLLSERFRARWPKWHRYLGRIQVVCVLLLVTPSGLWMAPYAAAGPIAALGLATLAVATAVCISLGAWSAMKWRFADHRRWMWRCFLLLCSAVVLRVLGGLATVMGVSAPWFDPVATWVSWLLPITVFELHERTRQTRRPVVPARPRARAEENRRQNAVVGNRACRLARPAGHR